MRVACVNQDPGIDPGRAKGAAVHLAAMRRVFAELGATTVAIDASEGVEELLEKASVEHPFDLLYERYALAKPAAARFANRRGIPFILEVNAPLSEEALVWRGYRETADDVQSDRFVFGSADGVIAVSTSVAEYAASRGARRDVVEVFPNGVDDSAFQPRRPGDSLRSELVPEGRFVLGFHGRLRPWHGFQRLLEASRRLIERGLPIHLLLVGNGEFSCHLRDAGLTEHSSVVGWQPHDRVGPYVAAFDALPLTYGDGDPCYFSPLKLAEAMACGVVPVVPALGDLPSTMDGAGMVYAPGDVDSLVDALGRLVERPALRRELAGRAVERAKRLSWRRIGEFVLAQAGVVTGETALEAVRGGAGW